MLPPQEREQIARMTQAQETANRIQELQLQILQREQERLDAKTNAEIDSLIKDIEKKDSEIARNFASALKTGEEAESEALANQIATDYTTSIIETLKTMRTDNDRPTDNLIDMMEDRIPYDHSMEIMFEQQGIKSVIHAIIDWEPQFSGEDND